MPRATGPTFVGKLSCRAGPPQKKQPDIEEGVTIEPVMDLVARRRVADNKPQQVTRIPPYRPGMWVKIKEFDAREAGSDLSGKIRRVKSLTCSITSPDQKTAVWRVHFEDGRCLEWHMIERDASDQEVRTALSRLS